MMGTLAAGRISTVVSRRLEAVVLLVCVVYRQFCPSRIGEIGLWHMPAVVSQRLQAIVEKATRELYHNAPTLFQVGNGPASWCDASLFKKSAANIWGYGTACLCYCWFQQGHDVSPSR